MAHQSMFSLSSREVLALALESISECVSITDKDNNLLYVNNAFLTIYGYERDEIIGQPVSILRADPMPVIHDEILLQTLEGGWKGELLNRKKDGTEFVVSLSTSIIRDGNNNFQGLIGVAVDISKAKIEAEAYRLLVDNSLLGSLIVQYGKIVFANPAATAILGYTAEELLSETSGSFLKLVHPLEKKAAKDIIESGPISPQMDLRFIAKNGDVIWAQLFLRRSNYKGSPAVQLAFLDITEKKSAEFAYSRIHEKIKKQNLVLQELLSNDPVDFQTSLSRVSQIASVTMNTDRVSVWLFDQGKTCIRCMQLHDRRSDTETSGQVLMYEDNPEYFNALISNRIVSVEDVFADKRTSGFGHYLQENDIKSMLDVRIGYGTELKGVVCFEECGQHRFWTDEEFSFASRIVDVISFILETRARLETEAALRESEKNLQDLLATKDAFFSIIAHDLKNHYHAISGFSALLHSEYEQYKDEERKEIIHHINTSADTTYKLLENLLQWSMVQTGQLQCKPEILDLSSLVTDTILMLKPQAELKGITLNTSIQYPSEVLADENMLLSVLRNILTNAIKYSGAKTKVNVRGEYASEGGKEWFILRVTDQGIGIHPDLIPLLFKFGENTRGNKTDRLKSTGLGLILCHEFMDKMQGKIAISSQEGKWTEVKISLPVPSAANH